MASELAIAVVGEIPTNCEELFDPYDIVVETSKRLSEIVVSTPSGVYKRWKIEETVDQKGVAVGGRDDEFDKILTRKGDVKGETCVMPSHLRLAMKQYANRERGNVSDKDLEKEILWLDDNQVVRMKESRMVGKVSYDTFFGAVHCRTTLAESIAYDRYPVANKPSCVHEVASLTEHLLLEGVYYVYHTPFFHIPSRDYTITEHWQETNNSVGRQLRDLEYGKMFDAKGSKFTWTPNTKSRGDHIMKTQLGTGYQESNDWFAEYKKILPNDEWVKKIPDIIKKLRELSSICSTKGVEYADESEDFDIYFTKAFMDELKEHAMKDKYVSRTHSKITNEYGRFATVLLICATRAFGRKVTIYCRYRAIHGALMYHKAIYPDDYNRLKIVVGWDFDKEMVGGLYRRDEPDIDKLHPLKRWDIYGPMFQNEREKGVTWDYHLESGEVDIRKGNPFEKEQMDEDNVNTPLICELDESKYRSFVEKIIDDEVWEVEESLDTMMKPGHSLMEMNIEKDVTIDDSGILHVPDYYGRNIHYNFYGNMRLQCHEVMTTGQTPQDKSSERLMSFGRTFGVKGWLEMGLRPCDWTSLGEGPELRAADSMRNPILDVLSKEIEAEENEWFGEWYRQAYSGKGLDGYCLSSVPTSKLLWDWGRAYFSILKHHAPVELLMRSGKQTMAIYPAIDCWDFDKKLWGCRDLDDIRIAILEYCFEGQPMEGRREALLAIRLEGGERRRLLLRRYFPRWSSFLEKDDVDGALAMNFLPMILCQYRGMKLDTKVGCIPLAFCMKDEVRLIPIDIKSTQRIGHAGAWLGWLIRSYGVDTRPKKLDEAQVILKRCAFEYYLNVRFLGEQDDRLHRSAHGLNYRHWLGERCGGVSDALGMIRTIVHPKPEFIAVLISDSRSPEGERQSGIVRRFVGLDESNIGLVHVMIDGDKVTVKTTNKARARVIKRYFRGLDHDLIIVKSSGRVFGNEYVVAKLANI
ncbi:VP2 [Tilligerry virus]|uniref:Outer capsid protein VP2 n=1 Tax=Tilligerry virus TaxID=1170505 RepID=H9ZXQ3_9REOV|nr:VP2 [Tilligerry virus]